MATICVQEPGAPPPNEPLCQPYGCGAAPSETSLPQTAEGVLAECAPLCGSRPALRGRSDRAVRRARSDPRVWPRPRGDAFLTGVDRPARRLRDDLEALIGARRCAAPACARSPGQVISSTSTRVGLARGRSTGAAGWRRSCRRCRRRDRSSARGRRRRCRRAGARRWRSGWRACRPAARRASARRSRGWRTARRRSCRRGTCRRS